jgi:hypothetical protein
MKKGGEHGLAPVGCKRTLDSQHVRPTQRSEPGSRSPRHELPQVVTKVTGQQIGDELAGGRKGLLRRRVGVLSRQ